MLDGLLRRGGFSSKCKSLIKLTRTRIDVIRRKRGATQKFLKKDIADLLANGLEQDAFGRAEGLFSELVLSSCYDFIDHVCDIILKHLSVMQKQRDCPEDCKEAVASLMFAAARFSDLPELRDLRDIFQERYGSSVEYKVNQKLVEHITPKPPAKEQKLQLLQDIASEFPIRWDAMAFEQRMTDNPAAREGHNQPVAHVPLHYTRNLAPQVEEPLQKKDKDDRLADKRAFIPQVKFRDVLNTESVHGQDDVNHNFYNGEDLRPNRHKSPPSPETVCKRENLDFPERRRGCKVDPYGSMCSENTRAGRHEPVIGEKRGDKLDIGAIRGIHEKAQQSTFSQQRVECLPTMDEKFVESPSYDIHDVDNVVILAKKQPGEETDGSKSKIKSSIPPPYMKPRRRSKQPELHCNEENNDTLSQDSSKRAQGSNAPEKKDGNDGHFTAEYYKDDGTPVVPTPRRRSRRRRTKSSSSPDNGAEEFRVVRRVSTSRRRNESSKEGLRILFDDDYDDHHHHRHRPRDEEEKMIDKLLQHYSKKDLSAGGGGSRKPEIPRRGKNEILVNASDASRSRRVRGARELGNEDQVQRHPSRSISLPRGQMTSSSETKVFTRAASFDQEASTPAKHVHPKLPDYDDLAARFAALRRNQE